MAARTFGVAVPAEVNGELPKELLWRQAQWGCSEHPFCCCFCFCFVFPTFQGRKMLVESLRQAEEVSWAAMDVPQSCDRILGAQSTGGERRHCHHTCIIFIVPPQHSLLQLTGLVISFSNAFCCSLVEEHERRCRDFCRQYPFSSGARGQGATAPESCSSPPHVSKRFYLPGTEDFPKCFY